MLIHELSIKNIEVYDYPTDPPTNWLLLACTIVVAAWMGLLVASSAWLSFKEPVENELIKKDEEVREPDHRDHREQHRGHRANREQREQHREEQREHREHREHRQEREE